MKESLASRLDKWTCKSGDCWIWIGYRTKLGYGVICAGPKNRFAHVVSYELAKGKVPEGLELDHQCDFPPCVNPDHLKPMTHHENLRKHHKKDCCNRGHKLTPENTYQWVRNKKTGLVARKCRKCELRRQSERWYKNNGGKR